MQIELNGKRNITLDFDAPKKFRLFKDGVEIPYIRTGKNSIRVGRGIDGIAEIEEIVEKPKIVKPMQLQPQQMALVNPNDVIAINQAAQQLEIEQGLLAETQKQVGLKQDYLDIQQQRINEAVSLVQNLETDNAERISATESGLFNLAGEIANVENNAVEGINTTLNELEKHKKADNPHKITKMTIGLDKVDNTSDLDKPVSKKVQAELDKKADKTEIEAIREEIGEYQEKNEKISNALSSYTGGLASMSDHRELEGRDFPDQHPIGAITGLQNALDDKVNKTAEASKVYGTDESGQQTTYNLSQLGGVSDVRVDGESVVTDNVANLGSMALEDADDYSTTTQSDSRYATASQGALADTSLQPNDNITELTNNAGYITIASVPTAVSQLTNDSNYQTGTQVANSISVETSNRESADNNLQSQIDAIVSSSDVFDIVGTYAELQAYDISTVPANDIIKVLVDSTHSGAATYYRCVENGGVKSWLYIGSEGAYYTKGEADAKFVPQTRTINGKALSSDISLTYSDVGADASGSASTAETNAKNYADSLSSNYATAAQGAKADTAVQPADISNMVTTDTAQDISAKKTFLGEKAILFKQTVATDKLGFTLYNTSGSELGALEYRPNTISGGALINLNTSQSGTSWLGFRYWSNINIIAPKPSNGNYYIPVNFTDGTNTVTASSNGTVNLSSILPNSAIWGNITGTLSNQTDLQTALNGKQDTISDLSTIRSGAELGATSIQPNDNVSELTNDAGYITGITSSDVTSALGYTPYNSTNPAGYTSNVGTVTSVNNTQPDANGNVTISTGGNYTAGTGIDITNNTISVDGEQASLVSLATVATTGAYSDLSGTPTVDQTYDGTSTNAQSGVAVAQALSSVSVSKDNLSITNNSNNQLQTVGVIDQNDTTQAIKTWTGTLAQYNAIVTKDPDTLYNITDDTAGGSSVYTKSEVDSLLNNIGFPTGQYIDLSSQIPLVANTAYSYTAPADGWFFFNARATANNSFLGCYGDSLYRHVEVWGNQEWMLCPPPLTMKKGQTISDIRASFTPTEFTVRFIYAKEN